MCIYQKELYKACFEHDMGYGDFKEERLLVKYYMIKCLILLKIQNMIDINVDLLQWFIFF